MDGGRKLGRLFQITSAKAHNPMCEVHLTMMTPWDRFYDEPTEEMVIEWFCIDCLEECNLRRVSEGKEAVSLGGEIFGKSDRDFYGCVETVN